MCVRARVCVCVCDSLTSLSSHHPQLLLAKQERQNQSERHWQQPEGEPSMQSNCSTWHEHLCSSACASVYPCYACLWTGLSAGITVAGLAVTPYEQLRLRQFHEVAARCFGCGVGSHHCTGRYFDLFDVTQTDNTRAPEQTHSEGSCRRGVTDAPSALPVFGQSFRKCNQVLLLFSVPRHVELIISINTILIIVGVWMLMSGHGCHFLNSAIKSVFLINIFTFTKGSPQFHHNWCSFWKLSILYIKWCKGWIFYSWEQIMQARKKCQPRENTFWL